MPTTVQKINGLSPTEWLADPNNVYAGRSYDLKSGKYQGETWHTQGWGNPFKFQEHFTLAEKSELLFAYVRELAVKLSKSAFLVQQFKELQGRNLGCWCTNWDGLGDVPLCHACWLARIVDTMFPEPSMERGVIRGMAVVYSTGEILPFNSPRIWSPGIVLEINAGKFVSRELGAK